MSACLIDEGEALSVRVSTWFKRAHSSHVAFDADEVNVGMKARLVCILG